MLVTPREQQLSIATPQPLSPEWEQPAAKDAVGYAEKLFTAELQGGWRISQQPQCIRLGWGPGAPHGFQSGV